MSAGFKVGDKVTSRVHPDFGIGRVVGFKGSFLKIRFGNYSEYNYRMWTRSAEEAGDYHLVGPESAKPYRTLAEKRQDDFEVLDAASRPWRDAPDYYKFPGDVQTTDISMHLNSNGGQAVGYISRSTRIDGLNKEADPRESLRKAIDLIRMEIHRLDQKFGTKSEESE